MVNEITSRNAIHQRHVALYHHRRVGEDMTLNKQTDVLECIYFQ